MVISRRCFLGLAAACAAAPALNTARAERYADISGLTPGRFVWHPTASLSGPVLIVVSLLHRSVHVYRGGTEIGFAPYFDGDSQKIAPGVYGMTEQPVVAGGGAYTIDANISWPALLVFSDVSTRYPGAGRIGLPADFARLLAEATPAGATILVADERSLPQRILARWPLPAAAPKLAQVGQFRFGQPPYLGLAVPAETYPPASGAAPVHTTLLLATAETQAMLIEDGKPQWTAPIVVSAPHLELGSHVYQRLVGDPNEPARWIAFGTGASAELPQIRQRLGEAALARISFQDAEVTQRVGEVVASGAIVVVAAKLPPDIEAIGDREPALLETWRPKPPVTANERLRRRPRRIERQQTVRLKEPAKLSPLQFLSLN